jgi:LacI family transcriptional regulator
MGNFSENMASVAALRDARLSSGPPRVLVVLGTNAAWCRGILRGFMAAAEERNWTLVHHQASTDLSWLADEWTCGAALIGPEPGADELVTVAPATLVSVAVDRSASGIASVVPDETTVGTLAAEHLLGTGLRALTTFRIHESTCAVLRERGFLGRALEGGAKTPPGYARSGKPGERNEDPAAIIEWLRGLPKPCGIFTCTDGWARMVARYARLTGLRIPDDIALVGADNDTLECELSSPMLSSVMIPWQEIGRRAAGLVEHALARQPIAGQRIVVPVTGVAARRSSEILAIRDPLVADAVRFIRAHADRRLTVPTIARAVNSARQRLERRFRAVLNRTVQEEVRRTHVDRAKHLLVTTHSGLSDIAKQSGFSSPALLNVAFQRELGMPPGAYRRSVRRETADASED